MHRTLTLAILSLPGLIAFTLTGCRTFTYSNAINISPSVAGMPVFEDTIKPILEHRCIQCHHDKLPSGGLNFQDRNLIFKGDAKGPFIVPGSLAESRVWQALIRPQNHPHTMPRDGWGMDSNDLEAFKAWIELGAPWPEGADGKLRIKEYRVTRRDYL
ncbi:MAG: hypothetical protein P1U89_16005 [Verrucomicrobiales bacterium]|nr:hypothetical protein [Verrucomicrobiales bacterium]